MPIKQRAEIHAAPTFESDLNKVYAYTVENHGTIPCEVAFDKDAPTYVPLPPGTSRSFDCIGNTPYQGTMIGRFLGTEAGSRRVIITKSVLICQK